MATDDDATADAVLPVSMWPSIAACRPIATPHDADVNITGNAARAKSRLSALSCTRRSLGRSLSTCSFLSTYHTTTISSTTRAVSVASAAPYVPSRGMPRCPNISP